MQLMISVMNAGEALEAAAGGADILDIKNPNEGSLGAQPPRVIREIRAAAPSAQISAALGDLPNLPGTAALAAYAAAACGANYVKAGLLGPRTAADAICLLQEVLRAVSEFPGVQVIAAGYADAARVGALAPHLLPEIAHQAGVDGCLLDTAVKDGHRLFDYLTPEQLQALGEEAHAAGLLFGLAGALAEEDLPPLRDLGADVAGIRTAACRGRQRTAPLDAGQVRRLRQILQP